MTGQSPHGAGSAPARDGTTSPRPGTPLDHAETVRYARHLVLPEVGREGQERLKAARVLLVGAGGLGSPAALYLAAAGVGTLGVVDPDVVDATNLQRQVLHGTSDLGSRKVDSAKETLSEINPHVRVEAWPARLTSANAMEIVPKYDVVVDGSDNFPTRYLVNDACVLSGRPNVYGSVYRWEGQLAVFGIDGGPCYRCLFREPPPPGMVPNCAEAGVFGALPGVIGAAQAMEAIKLLLGVGQPVSGRLQLFDALAYRWREIEVRRDHECPVCGDAPTVTAPVDYDLFCGTAPQAAQDHDHNGVARLEAGDLAAVMTGSEHPFLLDVREPREWDAMNLGGLGATLVPMGQVPARLEEIPRDRAVVVYCHSGVRSLEVAQFLHAQGYDDVRNLEGGITAVIEACPDALGHEP